MKKALLLVDIQNDYFPGGAYELSGMEQAATKAHDLLNFCRENDLLRVHIQHIERDPEAEFFLPETPGVEIHQTVAPASGEQLVQKGAPNSFLNTDLEHILRESKIDQVVLCGAMSHMCIDATCRAALDLGFSCTVIHDACATCDLEFLGSAIPAVQVHGAFMQALEDAGAEVVSLAELLAS